MGIDVGQSRLWIQRFARASASNCTSTRRSRRAFDAGSESFIHTIIVPGGEMERDRRQVAEGSQADISHPELRSKVLESGAEWSIMECSRYGRSG